MKFSLDWYRETILEAPCRKIRLCDAREYDSGLILRHDVDFSLSLAFEFSRMEKAAGVFSTYHVMLTSDAYNPFGRAGMRMLRQMAEEGFEIGLHFDARAYGNEARLDDLANAITVLETIVMGKVHSFSLHEPRSLYHIVYNAEKDHFLQDYINAYHPEFFGDDRYFSDSTYNARGVDAGNWLKRAESRVVQFLSHPIQYF